MKSVTKPTSLRVEEKEDRQIREMTKTLYQVTMKPFTLYLRVQGSILFTSADALAITYLPKSVLFS